MRANTRLAPIGAQSARRRLATFCLYTSLALTACLPFLVPFDAFRNTELQGLLLIVGGGFAWGALLLGYHQRLKPVGALTAILLGIFAAACVISLLVNPHFIYNLLGAPHLRLGAAGFLACLGLGLLVSTLSRRRVVIGLYVIITGLAAISVPYSWLNAHSLWRMGGVFTQADIFACVLGVGLLLGFEIRRYCSTWQRRLIGVQLFLFLLILLTQTRSVLLLLFVFGLIWLLHNWHAPAFKQTAFYLAAGLLLFAVLGYFLPSRLTNTSYAVDSVQYRLTLQRYALKASEQKPLWGYGPGNLADALSCPKLAARDLQTTCQEGYFFDSSHNIFIDRLLAVGWLGGSAFAALGITAVYKSLRGKKELRVFGYTAGLIIFYYCTNVTDIPLELLLWILLLRCLVSTPSRA